MIDQQTLNRVYDAIKIEDVVGDYVDLQRRGANYVGLCPFHHEKTPSFTVSATKGLYKCFGCGEGGNAVKFVQKIDNCSFAEAIKKIAKKYNIEVVEKELTEEEKREEEHRSAILRLNEWAAAWFEKQLWDTQEGQAVGLTYFRSRGLRDDIIRLFHLGYAPARCNLFQEAVRQGFAPELIKQASLGTADYPFFQERVIYPWFNAAGKVIGFNGRILKKTDAAGRDLTSMKYKNSSEIEGIYEKSRALYNINNALRYIGSSNLIYLVEGQMDVISMVQAGIGNVVASSGTSSFSFYHASFLSKKTDNITIIFDGDAAGQKGTIKVAKLCYEVGMNVKTIVFPPGEDPDSLSHKMSSDEFTDFINKSSKDLILHLIDENIDEAMLEPDKLSALMNSLVEMVSYIPDALRRESYIKICSRNLEVDASVLRQQVEAKVSEYEQKKRQRRQYPNRSFTSSARTNNPSTPTPATAQTAADNVSAQTPPTNLSPAQSRRREIEKQIAKLLLRKGEGVVFTYDNGDDCTLSDYIEQTFNDDSELTLVTPEYKQLVNLYLTERKKPNFDPDKLFAYDDLANAASELLIDHYELSKIYADDEPLADDEQTKARRQFDLLDNANHLMLDLRIAIVDELIEEQNNNIRNPQVMQDEAMMSNCFSNLSMLQKLKAEYVRARDNK